VLNCPPLMTCDVATGNSIPKMTKTIPFNE